MLVVGGKTGLARTSVGDVKGVRLLASSSVYAEDADIVRFFVPFRMFASVSSLERHFSDTIVES